MPESYRIAIVGAASLRGKELNESLGESSLASSEFVLMDDDSALGKLESIGDDVTFVQRIESRSFDRADFVFFAGPEEVTRRHWQAAQAAGASILDLSYALENEPNVLVRAPWVGEALQDSATQAVPALRTPDLRTPAIVPAHPVALALGLLLARLGELAPVRYAYATVLEPASEYGRAAMDELHQQTVTLLSFQTLPREVYDAQVAFNLAPVLGESAQINLAATENRIRSHYGLLSAGRLPRLGVQLLHAPVFHGQSISLAVELEEPATLEAVESALSGDHVDVVLGDADAPTNLTSAGQEDVLVRVRTDEAGEGDPALRFWIWAAMDNLKIASLNAVACALELRRLRPQGKVQ